MPTSHVFGGVVYDQVTLIDTSAAVALINEKDGRHEEAALFREIQSGMRFAAVDVTRAFGTTHPLHYTQSRTEPSRPS